VGGDRSVGLRLHQQVDLEKDALPRLDERTDATERLEEPFEGLGDLALAVELAALDRDGGRGDVHAVSANLVSMARRIPG